MNTMQPTVDRLSLFFCSLSTAFSLLLAREGASVRRLLRELATTNILILLGPRAKPNFSSRRSQRKNEGRFNLDLQQRILRLFSVASSSSSGATTRAPSAS